MNRSNRRAASLGSLCRRTPRLIEAGSQCAASSSTSVLVSLISVLAPPMMPASEMGPVSSQMTMSSLASSRCTSSSVVSFSPGLARRTTSDPFTEPASNACRGWPSSSIT